jgi:hypothetical protein
MTFIICFYEKNQSEQSLFTFAVLFSPCADGFFSDSCADFIFPLDDARDNSFSLS